MNGFLYILTLLIVIGVLGALAVWFLRKLSAISEQQKQDLLQKFLEAQKQDQSMQFLQREVNNLREQMSKSLSDSAKLIVDSQKSVGERLDRAAAVVGSVQKSLGSLDAATKQGYDVGKNIAQLQEILRAPKIRGSFGELFLGDLLAQILPSKHYALQYPFKTGETVDAVVKLGRLVPVDSKFPLENFQRLVQEQDPQEKTVARRKFVMDVKRHIDAIAEKYIRTDEGTFDFALMYIPAENVYYETVIKDDNMADGESIMTYAFSKRVVPVSPNSFYAYLHTISLGLKGLEIEENARLIIEQLSRLKVDFSRFKDDFETIGRHLNNARSKYEDAERRIVRFEDKLAIAGGSQDEGEAEELPKEPAGTLSAD